MARSSNTGWRQREAERDLAALERSGWRRVDGGASDELSAIRHDLEQACALLESCAYLLGGSTTQPVLELSSGIIRHLDQWRARYSLRTVVEIATERDAGIRDGSLLCRGCVGDCKVHADKGSHCGRKLRNGDHCHCGERFGIRQVLGQAADLS